MNKVVESKEEKLDFQKEFSKDKKAAQLTLASSTTSLRERHIDLVHEIIHKDISNPAHSVLPHLSLLQLE